MRRKVPDKNKARSMLNAATKDLNFTLTLKLNEESASTIVRNIYECFRMLGESMLASKGLESEDHITPINELLNLKVETSRPTQMIDQLRKLRHNINYYGYLPSEEEAKDAISVAKTCFWPLLKAIEDSMEIE